MRSRVQVSLPLRTINTLQRIDRFVFYLSKIATVIRSFLGKPVEFAFFEQDERDPGCRFRTTTFAGEKCLLTRKYFSRQFKVFYRHTQIAAHKRDRCEFHYTTDSDHMASQHKFRTEWTPERFLQKVSR